MQFVGRGKQKGRRFETYVDGDASKHSISAN